MTIHSRFARTPRRRYLCLDCRRTFTDLTGTPFAGTNLRLAIWLRCLALLGTGLSTGELARAIGVKWDTGARMRTRLSGGITGHGLLSELRRALRHATALGGVR